MPQLNWTRLAGRGVVSVTGADASKLLDGVLTNDMDRLQTSPALHAGLLTPQGKILFEIIVVRVGDGVLLDVARPQVGDLIKRLSLYRLRAKVEFTDISDATAVMAAWGARVDAPGGVIAFDDPRAAGLGERVIVPVPRLTELPDLTARGADYTDHRLACGVAELGTDYGPAEVFPHEANFDVMGSVDFKKGCYVGQEVVSRMQHKTVVRKRIVRLYAPSGTLAPGREVLLGDVQIATLASASADGALGLALTKLDRVVEGVENDTSPCVDGQPVRIDAAALDRYRGQIAHKAAAQGAL